MSSIFFVVNDQDKQRYRELLWLSYLHRFSCVTILTMAKRYVYREHGPVPGTVEA